MKNKTLIVAWVVTMVVALLVSLGLLMFLGAGSGSTPSAGCTTTTDPAVPASGPLGSDVQTAARAALAAGWNTDDATTAVAIAGAESRYDRTIVNPLTISGSNASGMWQIMMPMHAALFAPGEDWRDPYANARVAHKLWASGGWQPWTTYTSGAYLAHLGEAKLAVAAASANFHPGDVVPAVQDTTTDCTPAEQPVAAGTVVYPEPPSTDRHNYGGTGSNWSSYHTGTDFSVSCGTPVHAATGGVVRIEHGPSWYGNWLVKVETGPHSLTTWYAHMQALSVTDGQTVTPGQVLGEVGQLGNATGCHLHFEVHPHNGSIYEDGVDPSKWLAENVGKNLSGGGVPAVPVANPTGPEWFRIASFNVLGSVHTIPGHSEHPGFPQGPARMVGAVAVLEHYGVDIAGLQEFENNQKQAFQRITRGTWGVYSGTRRDTDNSIVWRTSEWSFVSGTTVPILYFYGHTRHVPVVRLRSARGDVIVANTHNPANVRGNATHLRAVDVGRQIAMVAQLRARYPDTPVFLTGDFNEKSSLFCAMTANGLLHNAGGGSVGRPCRLPRYVGIDWIFGTPDVRFTGFAVDKTLKARQITDHPIVVAAVG